MLPLAWRIDPSGLDGVDADSVLRQLHGPCSRHVNHCRFGAVVGRRQRVRPDALHGADRNDAAAVALSNHLPGRQLRAVKDRPERRPPGLLHVLDFQVDQQLADRGRRVVQQDVDSAKRADGIGEQAFAISTLADVRLSEDGAAAERFDLRNGLGGLALQQIREGDVRAFFCQRQGGRFSDAPRAAGDDCCLA